jgi:biopolymer transport protein ExbB
MPLGLMEQGGPVMWVITVCGAVALIVFVERSLHLHRARIKADDFLKGIFNIVGRQNIPEAITICEETPGPVAYVVKTAILHRREERTTLQDAIADASRGEISRMERRLVVLATVGQIAPLLGLLGTVLGMFDALVVLQREVPLIHSAEVLGGLRRALLTTAAGLSVAVPCYIAFNTLVVKIDRIVLDMERAASEMVAFLKGGWSAQTPGEPDHAVSDDAQ